MSQQSVLYDTQGPRARRRTRIATVVALLALAVIGYAGGRNLTRGGVKSVDERAEAPAT